MCGTADFPTALIIAFIVVLPLILSAWALDVAHAARRDHQSCTTTTNNPPTNT